MAPPYDGVRKRVGIDAVGGATRQTLGWDALGQGLHNPGRVRAAAHGEMRNDVCHGPLVTCAGLLPGLRRQRVQVVLQTLILGLEYLYTFFDCAHGYGSSI